MERAEVRFFEGRKFMWDGEEYPSREDAERRRREYEEAGFETRMLDETEAPLLYTRRVVKEVVVEGQPPPA